MHQLKTMRVITRKAKDFQDWAAASHYLATKYNTKYDPESQILITAGATGGIYSSLTAMLNKGDTVIIPTPIFPLYIPIVLLNGAADFIDISEDGFI